MRSRPFAVGPCVVHPHHHRVRDLAGMGWTTVPPHIGNDQGTVTEPELSAVILADAHPLDKPEGRRKPGDRLAHVGVCQDRDHRCRRDRAIGLHGSRFNHREHLDAELAPDLSLANVRGQMTTQFRAHRPHSVRRHTANATHGPDR